MLFSVLRPLDFETFIISYSQIYAKDRNIAGCALYFCRGHQLISPYIVHSIFRSHVIYEKNILISLNRIDEPYGVSVDFKQDLGPGLEALAVAAGYREALDIEGFLKEYNIAEKVIFYGVEDIVTSNRVWHVFGLIKTVVRKLCSVQQIAAQPPAQYSQNKKNRLIYTI